MSPSKTDSRPALSRPVANPAGGSVRSMRSAASVHLLASLVAAASLGAMLAGCSDLYYDRRDSIALSAGDAIAANAAEQTVDPWPPYSGDTNIPVSGQRMATAVERYRANKTVQPQDAMMLEGIINQQQSASPAQTSSTNNGASTQ
jgi:hypothetical protein